MPAVARSRSSCDAWTSWAWRRIPGTEGGEQPFFSPDGKWIAFFANHQMRKVAVTGGPSTVLAELPGGLAYGGAWVPDGRIVVSRGNSLAIIPAGGGAVSLLSATDTATDRLLMNPKVLPTAGR